MNKNMNYFAIIPIYGSIILFLWLFVKMIKQEINKKRFQAYFISSAVMGFLSILVAVLGLNFINSFFDITNFMNHYGLFAAFIIGGYIMNIFAFVLVNKKWDDLERM